MTNMASQTGLTVARPGSCKEPNLSWKMAKKEPKGQTKILGPASVIWNQNSQIWPQKDQPGNPDAAACWSRRVSSRFPK